MARKSHAGMKSRKRTGNLFLFSALSFTALLLLAHPNQATGSPLDSFGNEPIIPITESALMTDGLYDAFLNNDLKGIITSSSSKTEQLSKFQTKCQPKHIHLSVGKQPWESMTVSFTIPRKCSIQDIDIKLLYGVDLEHIESQSIHDPQLDLVDYDFNSSKFDYYQSGYIFHIPLTGLKHAQTYIYQIMVLQKKSKSLDAQEHKMDDKAKIMDLDLAPSTFLRNRKLMTTTQHLRHDSIATSPVLSFQTTHCPEKQEGTKLAIVADLGQTYNSTVTMLHMYRHSISTDDPMQQYDSSKKKTTNTYKPASMILCAGDMSYSDYNQKRWDSWFDLIEPLISRIPIQVSAGNHEFECESNSHDVFTPYETRFFMPHIQPALRNYNKVGCDQLPKWSYDKNHSSYEYGNSYYAFTQGLTRIIALNSYAYIAPGSHQYQWLQQELEDASANRLITPWILVMVHVPLYNTFAAHQNEDTTLQMLEFVEQLFLQHKVNFVMSGHAHGYSRSTNVAYGTLDATAPIYITVGEGGNREQHTRSYQNEQPEEWIAKRDITEYGFGTLEFFNSTWAQWKWIRNEDDVTSYFTDDVFIENQFFL